MSLVDHMQGSLQQAIVKSAPADDYLQIAVVLAGKRRLMDRPKNEALQKTLARMQKNAMLPIGASISCPADYPMQTAILLVCTYER